MDDIERQLRESAVDKDDADHVPTFRAINLADGRHGIRLENIYWRVLGDAAKHHGLSLARYIGGIATGQHEAKNLTSLLRVSAARWLVDQLEETRSHTGPGVIDALVQASPSPAIALHEDKRIVSYNQAFLNFIQSRFSRFSSNSMARGLRLSLDIPISELAETLRKADGKPVRTGFVLGLDDQRLRGQLSATLGPSPDKTTIIGFVAPL